MSFTSRIKSAHVLTALALSTVALAAPLNAEAADIASSTPTEQASAKSGLKPGWQKSLVAKKRKEPKRGVRAYWRYDSPTGRPGAVTSVTPVSAVDQNLGYGATLLIMNNAGPTVTRSSYTTGAQDVAILYSLQVWNGYQWVQQTTRTGSARIPAGYSSVRLPHLAVYPTAFRGYTRVTIAMGWYVAGTQTQLGHTWIAPHVASDQVCVLRSRPCASYDGFMRLGSVMGGW